MTYLPPLTNNPQTVRQFQVDTQIIVTPMADWKVGKWIFSLSAPITFELNRYFVRNNNVDNLQVVTSARYLW